MRPSFAFYFLNLLSEIRSSTDTLYATDSKGNVDTGNSMTMEKGILSELEKDKSKATKDGYKGTFANTNNRQTADALFRFAAKNSNVEWGLNSYVSRAGNQSKYTVYTSWMENEVHRTVTRNRDEVFLREFGNPLKFKMTDVHSHSKTECSSDADRQAEWNQHRWGAGHRSPLDETVYLIYYIPNNRYYDFKGKIQ